MITRKSFILRSLLLLGFLLALIGGIVWLHLGFEVVVPDEIYGSPQLSASDLKEKIEENHIRSILNLRGKNPSEEWYREEKAVAKQHHVVHIDCGISSEFLPLKKDLISAVRFLEESPKPLLIHCESGIDRTGLMCMIYLLLTDDSATPENIFEHLSIWKGHLPWRKSMSMKHALLHQYEDWLKKKKRDHSPKVFRDWIFTGYIEPQLH